MLKCESYRSQILLGANITPAQSLGVELVQVGIAESETVHQMCGAGQQGGRGAVGILAETAWTELGTTKAKSCHSLV